MIDRCYVYDPTFVADATREEILTWLGTLRPLWEMRYSTKRPPPPGKQQKPLLRPVYWLGNWQFACLGYYEPPRRTHGVAVAAEPFPPVLARMVSVIERRVRSGFPPAAVPRGWHLNTCLVNFYGARAEAGKEVASPAEAARAAAPKAAQRWIASPAEAGRAAAPKAAQRWIASPAEAARAAAQRWIDVARVGEHRDFEPGPVASVSLGERARFQFVRRGAREAPPVRTQWLEDRSLQIFGGPRWKDDLLHRVQRVDDKQGLDLPPRIDGFRTRRVNFTFRYVPDEHVVPFAKLPPAARDDVRDYVTTLASTVPHFADALASERRDRTAPAR